MRSSELLHGDYDSAHEDDYNEDRASGDYEYFYDDKGYDSHNDAYSERSRHSGGSSSVHNRHKNGDRYRPTSSAIKDDPARRDSIKMYPERYEMLRKMDSEEKYDEEEAYHDQYHGQNTGNTQRIEAQSGGFGRGREEDDVSEQYVNRYASEREELSKYSDRQDIYSSRQQYSQGNSGYGGEAYHSEGNDEEDQTMPLSGYDYASEEQEYMYKDTSKDQREYMKETKEEKHYKDELEKAYSRKYDSQLDLGSEHPSLTYQDSIEFLEKQRDMGIVPDGTPLSENQSEVVVKPLALSESKHDLQTASGSLNSKQTFSSNSSNKQQTQPVQQQQQIASGVNVTATTSASTGKQIFPRPGYKLMGYPPVEVPITDDNASQADSTAQSVPLQDIKDPNQTYNTTATNNTTPRESVVSAMSQVSDLSHKQHHLHQSSFDQSELGYQESFDSVEQGFPSQDSYQEEVYPEEIDVHRRMPSRGYG